MTLRRYTQIVCRTLAEPQLRVRQYNGRDHLVVPVVAMVGDIIVRPMGSRGPEFVPARVLARAPGNWNNRPILPDHPNTADGSANDPATLEQMQMGATFNAEFRSGSLQMEAWIDPQRARLLGGDAETTVNRIREGEVVEVSVGAFVTLAAEPGEHEGVPYEYVWLDAKSDHLAMGLGGKPGACSVDAGGCGAPRNATHQPYEEDPMSKPVFRAAAKDGADGEDNTSPRSWLRALGAMFGMRSNVDPNLGVSDIDIRHALTRALRAEEPGFEGLYEVWPFSKAVIYATMPEDDFMHFRRTFTLDEETGEVSLNDDAEEVDIVPTAVPVAAAEGACSCGTQTSTPDPNTEPGAEPEEEEVNVSKKQTKDLVAELLEGDAPFDEDDRTTLEALSEAKLSNLVQRYSGEEGDEGSEEPAAEPAQPKPQAKAAEPSEAGEEGGEEEAEEVASIPKSELEDLRAAAAAHKAQVKARRDELVTQLADADHAFDEDDLADMALPVLEKLARSIIKEPEQPARPRSYAGRGLPGAGGAGDKPAPLPRGYTAALKARKGSDDSTAN